MRTVSELEGSFRSRLTSLVPLLGCALLLAGCSKPSKESRASATSASATAPVASEAIPPSSPKTRAAVPRDSLKPPPLMAPVDAATGAGGVRFQVLRAGSGDSPGPVDTILVDFSMWTADGRLAFSSYPESQPTGFSVSTLPPNLRVLLTQLKVGSHVLLWVPRAALAGWKPPPWPDADLVFDLELLAVSHVNVRDTNGNPIEPVPSLAPDAAGPPNSAEKTRSGLRYVYLTHAVTQKPPTGSDRLNLLATAYVVEGIEVKLLRSGFKTATTLARAPGKLGELLPQLSSGDRVRVWLPKGEGRAIIAEAGTREMILDLGVSF